MASIKIVLGGGNPTYTLDIGDDETALQTMRDGLERDAVAGWQLHPDFSPTDTPDTLPTYVDWQTVSAAEVVEAYAGKMFRAMPREANRRKPR